MIKISTEKKGTKLFIRLSGIIEESTDFHQLIGPPQPEMEINCKEIARINSIGIKSWLEYFGSCQKSGTKLTFTECSIPVVEYISMMSQLTFGGKVESAYVPFSCPNCHSELESLFAAKDLKVVPLVIPNIKCTHCGKDAVFDGMEEIYQHI